MYDWNQERIIAISNEAIYNIKKLKVMRKIPIFKIGGISKTTTPGKYEFTIHVPSEYDYRFISER